MRNHDKDSPRMHVLLRSGRPEDSHLQSPTEPYVSLSTHTARVSRAVETLRLQRDAERTSLLPVSLVGKPLLELTHPLRSPLITSDSSLLRDNPPSPCASILSPFVDHTYRVFSSHHRESSHVPAKSRDQRHAISTPDTAQPRHRLSLDCSQATKQDPVLMSSYCFRCVGNGSLAFVSLVHT